MRTIFVADPLAGLDPATDTTIGLMHAAQDRGSEVWFTEGSRLDAVDGRARAHATPIRLAPSRPAGDHRWIVAEPWYSAGEPEHIWLDDAGAVFMRLEPPVDPGYLTATLVLDLVDPARAALVNNPSGLRVCSEHLFPLHFPDLIPPTVVTADAAVVRAFVRDHQRAVAKPVDGFAGQGVLLLRHGDPNLASLIEIATGGSVRQIVVQPFLPEVADGNKRIFVLGGEPVAAVYRFPADGDFRIGAPSAVAPLTSRDREICDRLAPALRRHGIWMAGLDVIGNHLIEVNVTCPGALRKADALLGWTLCGDALDAVFEASDLRRYA